MNSKKWEMVITDLDGTLFNDNKEVSITDMKSLYWLGENNILRVIATGRNFYSLNKVIKPTFPIDYLIFSSGAGIYDWKNRRLLHSEKIDKKEVKEISRILIDHRIDFMIHKTIPENHHFLYHRVSETNPDFERRIEVYKEFAIPLNPLQENYDDACQIIAVLPNNIELFKELTTKFTDLKIIRTTSPLDGESIWMEIFPENVSKGHAIKWLCNKLKIPHNKTIGIGNDYNDLDMLEFTDQSYIVANAPDDLQKKFPVCSSNQEHAFSDVVSRYFDI